MISPVSGLTAPAADSTTPQPRLVKASHEFEAQMMKELLKPLSSNAGFMGSDEDADTGSNAALGEYATEALGQALSNQGGLGLSHRIVQDLSRVHSTANPGTADLQGTNNLKALR